MYSHSKLTKSSDQTQMRETQHKPCDQSARAHIHIWPVLLALSSHSGHFPAMKNLLTITFCHAKQYFGQQCFELFLSFLDFHTVRNDHQFKPMDFFLCSFSTPGNSFRAAKARWWLHFVYIMTHCLLLMNLRPILFWTEAQNTRWGNEDVLLIVGVH